MVGAARVRAQHFGPSHRALALTALKKEPPYQEEISCKLRADKGVALRVPATGPGAAGLGAGAAAQAPFGTCTSCGEGALWDPAPQLLSGVLGDPMTSTAAPDLMSARLRDCVQPEKAAFPFQAPQSHCSNPGPVFPELLRWAVHYCAMFRQPSKARMCHIST